MGLKIVKEKVLSTDAEEGKEIIIDATHVLGWVVQVNGQVGVDGTVTVQGSVDGETFMTIDSMAIAGANTVFIEAEKEFYFSFMKIIYGEGSSTGGQVDIFLGTKGI